MLTGRLSLADDPWLAGHTVFGRVIVPGSVFVEFALAAADRAGLGRVEELTLEAVLALPAEGGVTVQVLAGPADESGRRPVGVHARGEDAGPGGGWIRHASGILGPAAEPAAAGLVAWPPDGAVVVPLEGFYERLSAAGLGYGPSFRGLRAVWRRGGEVFAEVALPEGAAAEGFGLHPVLLDAALHAAAVGIAEGGAQVELPFSWAGVSLHAARAVMARVRLEPLPGGHGVCVSWPDGAGAPVATVEALATRPARLGSCVMSSLPASMSRCCGCGGPKRRVRRLPRLAGVLPWWVRVSWVVRWLVPRRRWSTTLTSPRWAARLMTGCPCRTWSSCPVLAARRAPSPLPCTPLPPGCWGWCKAGWLRNGSCRAWWCC